MIADEKAVREALSRLTTEELLRLERVARVLGSLTLGRTHGDLLQEAALRTLSGVRSWNTEVDLMTHLFQTMRSIASSWRKQNRERSSGTRLSEDTASDSAMTNARSKTNDPESLFLAQDLLGRIGARFADDPVASQTLAGWRMGWSGPEIQEIGGFSKTEFAAAVKRIRRGATKEANRE